MDGSLCSNAACSERNHLRTGLHVRTMAIAAVVLVAAFAVLAAVAVIAAVAAKPPLGMSDESDTEFTAGMPHQQLLA